MAATDRMRRASHLVLVDDTHVLELSGPDELHGTQGNRDALEVAARMGGPLLASLMRKSSSGSAHIYELSPESQRMLKHAQVDGVGTYFRGVLRDSDGKISHQVQLREARRAEHSPRGIDLVTAAQLAAIQIQLTRIEDAVYAVGVDVQHVLNFVQDQQRARISACMALVEEVYNRALKAGGLRAPTGPDSPALNSTWRRNATRSPTSSTDD